VGHDHAEERTENPNQNALLLYYTVRSPNGNRIGNKLSTLGMSRLAKEFAAKTFFKGRATGCCDS